jgi:hypothetical protein
MFRNPYQLRNHLSLKYRFDSTSRMNEKGKILDCDQSRDGDERVKVIERS